MRCRQEDKHQVTEMAVENPLDITSVLSTTDVIPHLMGSGGKEKVRKKTNIDLCPSQ